MYSALSGHTSHRSDAGCAWRLAPLHLSPSSILLLLLLATCLLLQCGPSSASAQEIRSPGGKPHKFMRWGKRFFDSPDSTGLNSKPAPGQREDREDDLVIPVFGTDQILCKLVAPGGIYKCINYRTPQQSASTYQGE